VLEILRYLLVHCGSCAPAATASESLTTFLDDFLIAAIASKMPRVCAVSLGRKFNFQENHACLS